MRSRRPPPDVAFFDHHTLGGRDGSLVLPLLYLFGEFRQTDSLRHSCKIENKDQSLKGIKYLEKIKTISSDLSSGGILGSDQNLDLES